MTQGPGRDRFRTAADLPDPADDRFAIPELCTPAALSLLVIAAELLALVVTLLGSEPDWLRFAVASLFIQWSALGSAGALCLGRSRLARMPSVPGRTVAAGCWWSS
ncbi:MAG: hypothetical protein U5R48_05235 [Gammaproteobacteria bacterium]|nr:hypothetical protein [Gammaproteobacteria bacterium]